VNRGDVVLAFYPFASGSGGKRRPGLIVQNDADNARMAATFRTDVETMNQRKKMHADELNIDAVLVSRLITSQFPEWAELTVEPVAFLGTDNFLYRLGSDKVVRLPRRQQNAAGLEKERQWLPKLAPLLPMAVPVPLATGEPAEGYPFDWAIYRWLEGEPATSDKIDMGQAATDLATFVAALQRVDPAGGPPPGEHNSWRGVPLVMRDWEMRSAISSLGSAIDAKAVTAVWKAALSASDSERAPVWIHGDLDSRNLLAREGRLTAVIDFGCLGVGDPACDVMVAWKILAGGSRDIFLSALSADEATRIRARGWVLSQALIALAYYTVETNPVLVREARRWMAEVLADESTSRRGDQN
jgi:aminoglycoside phosphotransferase (APT) family kinase protein